MHTTRIDQAAFNELKGMTGPEFLPELIDAYFSDTASMIEELKTTLQAGDSQRFGRAAHSIKGNSATFGAASLASIARELEMMGKSGSLEGAEKGLQALEVEYELVKQDLEALRDEL
jgi:HPt (histidine-containing phosphotransfer) domain-containing protein